MSRDVSNVVMEVCHQRIHMPRDGRSVLIKVCVVREKTCLGMRQMCASSENPFLQTHEVC